MILGGQGLWEQDPRENALEDETEGGPLVSLRWDWVLPDLSMQAVCLEGDCRDG